MRLATFRKRDRPDRSLIAPFGVERLVPATVVQIGVARVLAFLGCAVAFSKVFSTTLHLRTFRKRDVRFANRVGVVKVIL